MITLKDQIKEIGRELDELRQPPVVIPLEPGLELKVENRDLWVFGYWRWSLHRGRNTNYLYRQEGGKRIWFHNEIKPPPPGFIVDHADRDGLNDCRYNLRFATHQQNMWNRNANYTARTSQFKGVDFHSNSGLWRARIRKGATVYTSYHQSERDAAKAHDAIAKEYHGEFACLNFPDTFSSLATRIAVMDSVYQTLKSMEARDAAPHGEGLGLGPN